jgi:hypothetical protein
MNETQRQTYLKAMGIQGYYPRRVLPGAKPSPQYDFDEEADSVVASAAESTPEDQGGKSLRAKSGRSNSALDEIRAGSSSGVRLSQRKETTKQAGSTETSKTKQDPLQTESKSPATEQQAELRFSLNYYRVSPTLALINEAPHQNGSNADGQVLALMKAILLALSLDVDTDRLQSESFSWPFLTEMTEQDNSTELAAKALGGFIKGRQEQDRFTDLLVFAGRSEELIMGADGDKRDFPSACGGFNITVSKTLHSMLVHPALKREVWQQLQPLRKRLCTLDATTAG